MLINLGNRFLGDARQRLQICTNPTSRQSLHAFVTDEVLSSIIYSGLQWLKVPLLTLKISHTGQKHLHLRPLSGRGFKLTLCTWIGHKPSSIWAQLSRTNKEQWKLFFGWIHLSLFRPWDRNEIYKLRQLQKKKLKQIKSSNTRWWKFVVGLPRGFPSIARTRICDQWQYPEMPLGKNQTF